MTSTTTPGSTTVDPTPKSNATPTGPHAERAALLLVVVGICAAAHIWKVPPALPELQAEFNLSLVASGFLLSIVQLGGLLLGLPIGLLAQRIGLRRCILIGLGILVVASLVSTTISSGLVVLVGRAVEGVGFLMVVMPVPALIRRLVHPGRLSRVIGIWGAYMPVASGLVLLGGAWVLTVTHWQALWLILAIATAACQWVVWRMVPPDDAHEDEPAVPMASIARVTLSSLDVWLVALMFGLYSSQWIAIVGFLPTIYDAQGVSGLMAGVLTAIVAGSNAFGNMGAGRLLHHGVAGWKLLVIGLLTMIVCAYVAFGAHAPPLVQFLAVLTFSLVGGLVPSTLFVLGLDAAPTQQAASATIGWMQQCSSLGQFVGPPAVAWVVHLAGNDWQWTWVATSCFALTGIFVALVLRHRAAMRARQATAAA